MRIVRYLIIFLFLAVSAFQLSCTQEEEYEFTIGFSQCISSDAWRQSMHAEMLRELEFHDNIELLIKDADGDNQTQVNHIQELIQQGVDLIIVSPNEAEPITPIVEKAFNLGIPVIVLDRKTSSSLYTAYIGADNYEIGKIAGHYIVSVLGGRGNILEIWGLKGSTPAIERHQGFQDVIDQYPELSIIAEVAGEWERDTAANRITEVEGIPNIDLVYAHNDDMAYAAYEYFKKIGKNKDVKFIGVDGLAGPVGGIQWVIDEIIDATFLYPTGGQEAIQLAVDILENKVVDKENILTTTVIDQSNVRVLKLQSDKIISQQANIERQQQKLDDQLQLYQNQSTVLYIIVFSLVISIVLAAFLIYSLRSKQEINHRLERTNNEILRQKEEIEKVSAEAASANNEKVRFFTNISHEFRTPLSLILAPVEELIARNNLPVRNLKDLQLIKKNSLRLLRLINQVMDFRKIENSKLIPNLQSVDIVRLLNDIISDFTQVAKQKNVDLDVLTSYKSLFISADVNMLDKVFFNLISNALKFTQSNAFIHVTIERSTEAKNCIITVADNGRGMSEEHVLHAFDRYYQGTTYTAKGTGLGLALSKELIELQSGTISVQSKKFEGTEFTITIPLSKDDSEPVEEVAKEPLNPELHEYLLSEFQEIGIDQENEEASGKSVLVVDDNPEILSFLSSILSKSYQVIGVSDGRQGIEKALEVVPDLIISDVVMPETDGISLVEKIKTDFRTSHIPVILLTAMETDETVMRGVKAGADLYLTKPFNPSLLKASIKSMLHNRDLLKAFYNKVNSLDSEIDHPVDMDQKFISDFRSLLIENLGNPDFSVENIYTTLGLSRVQLYRKVKALFDCGVNDYLLELRLQHAKRLLLATNKTISEIGYESGFSSPAYFSTAFKNKFELSPSEYKTQKS